MFLEYAFTGYGYLKNWELVKYGIDKLNAKNNNKRPEENV